MKRVLILTLLVLALIPLVSAQEGSKTCVYFFYGAGCPHCARVEPLIDSLELKYPDVELVRFEIYHNEENALLLNQYFSVYEVPDKMKGIPAVFISNKYLIGDRPILANLEKEIKDNPGAGCPELKKDHITGIGEEASPLNKLGAISFITIAGAAFVDSINPCAIAVLLILLASLFLASEFDKLKRALKAGFMFILSVYIVYFLFGLGMFALFKEFIFLWVGAGAIIKKVVGVIAILIGLLNIKDYFWYGSGGFVMEIPRRWRPRMKMLLRSVTSPISAFFLGFLVSAFELPCTGGPYFFVIGYLSDKATYTTIIPILLLYNFIFVLPLIIITLLMYYGVTSIESAEGWKERNTKKLHLAAGLIMLALGALVYFS